MDAWINVINLVTKNVLPLKQVTHLEQGFLELLKSSDVRVGPMFWINCIQSLLMRGLIDPIQSYACYDKALGTDEKYIDDWNRFGNILLNSNKAHHSTKFYDRCIEIKSDYI